MARVWTHGVWTVKEGREQEFVAAWRLLIPIGERLGSGDARLLRDRDRANVFRSFGSWPDLETAGRFRDEIRPLVGGMDELLDGFETFTLDEAHPGD